MNKRKAVSDYRFFTPNRSVFEEYIERDILRELPSTGTIFVREGEEVSPADILGECYVSKGFRVFNVAEIIGIRPSEVAQYLKKEIGAKVFKDEVLAEVRRYLGTLTKQFVVPCDGVLESLNEQTGQLTIRFLPEKLRLVSGFYGKIVEIAEDKKLRIRTQVHIIKSQIGIGIKREGLFTVVGNMNENLTPTDITSEFTKRVICGGALITKELIQKSIVLGVKAVIGGGINARDYHNLIGSLNPSEDVGISILIVEGFGRSDIHPHVAELMAKFSNRHVIVDPSSKELIIPLIPDEWKQVKKKSKKSGNEHDIIGVLNENDEVVILSWPYMGKRGVVTKRFDEPKELGSQIMATVIQVKLDDGKEVLIPVQNVEIMAH